MAARGLIVRLAAGLIAGAGVAAAGSAAALLGAVPVALLIACGRPAAARLALLLAVAALALGGTASVLTGPLLLLAAEIAFDAPVGDTGIDRPFAVSRGRSLALTFAGALAASAACLALAAPSARGAALECAAALGVGALVLALGRAAALRRSGDRLSSSSTN